MGADWVAKYTRLVCVAPASFWFARRRSGFLVPSLGSRKGVSQGGRALRERRLEAVGPRARAGLSRGLRGRSWPALGRRPTTSGQRPRSLSFDPIIASHRRTGCGLRHASQAPRPQWPPGRRPTLTQGGGAAWAAHFGRAGHRGGWAGAATDNPTPPWAGVRPAKAVRHQWLRACVGRPCPRP